MNEPADVAAVLGQNGWVPGRDVTTWAREAVAAVADDGFASIPAAVEALTEYGGLYVVQDGPGVDVRRGPFALVPAMAVHCRAALAAFAAVLGVRLFPIGVEGDADAFLVVDELGRVFSLDAAGEWFLGDDIGSAVATLVTGAMPRRVDDEGRW